MLPDKLNILLIEDNPADSGYLKSILAEEKQIYIKTSLKKNLNDGIKYCMDANNEIDVVLLDLSLPDSDGIETVKTFCEAMTNYPVIVLSLHDDSELAIKSLNYGAEDFIVKGEYEHALIIKTIIYSIERHKQKIKNQNQKENLAQFEEKLKTVIENDLDGILIVDNKGVIRFSNPTAENLFEMSSGQLKGKTFGLPVLGENNIAEIELFAARKKQIIAELQMVGISWQGTDVFLCTIRDITERRITERAIRENEEKFMAIAHNSSDAIIHLDDLQNIVFVNSAAEKVFGVNKDDILKIGVHYVFNNNPELLKVIDGLGNGASKKSHIAITGFRKNEDSFPMEVSLSTFKRKGKRQVVCILRDTTDRKRAETDLFKTQRQLETTLDELKSNRQKLVEVEKLNSVKELAGAISHEFAQPLQALYNYLHLIQNVESKEEYFQKSREMLNRVSDLTTNLKNITSIRKMDYLESKIIDIFASSDVKRTFTGLKILVVDDEREILETMMDIFKDAGYLCKGASDGKEAFDLIQNETFDLILCDVMMPRMSGSELLRKVKKQKNPVHFIFLTGYDISDESKNIINSADFTIQKPVSSEELLACVENVLQS